MLVDPWSDEEGQQAFYRQIAQANERFTIESETEFSRITEPVHIVWGVEDTWIPADRARRLQALIPDTSAALVPDAGHLIQLDAPAAISAELSNWLVTVSEGKATSVAAAPSLE